MSLLLLIYDILVKPFESPLLNKMEIFNEISIIVAAYHLPLFTEFVDDQMTHYFAGWSLILLVILNITVNLIVMFKLSIIQIRAKLGPVCLNLKNRFCPSKQKKGQDFDFDELDP